MPHKNESGQVLQEPIRLISSDTTQFTRFELARTLGELAKLGLIQPYHDFETRRGRICEITRYRLTEQRP